MRIHKCLYCAIEIGELPNFPSCTFPSEDKKSEDASEARWADLYSRQLETVQAEKRVFIKALEFAFENSGPNKMSETLETLSYRMKKINENAHAALANVCLGKGKE